MLETPCLFVCTTCLHHTHRLTYIGSLFVCITHTGLTYIVVIPTNVTELRIDAYAPEDGVCTVDRQDPAKPVKILPQSSQTIVVQVSSNETGAKITYALHVQRVAMGTWSSWDGGMRYPVSSGMAPLTQISSTNVLVHAQPELQDLYVQMPILLYCCIRILVAGHASVLHMCVGGGGAKGPYYHPVKMRLSSSNRIYGL